MNFIQCLFRKPVKAISLPTMMEMLLKANIILKDFLSELFHVILGLLYSLKYSSYFTLFSYLFKKAPQKRLCCSILVPRSIVCSGYIKLIAYKHFIL